MTKPNQLWLRLSEWSQKTFGSDRKRGPIGPLKHLIEEVHEAIQAPGDIYEYADCQILLFDAVRRAGFSFDLLFEAALEKIEINKKRTYPRPLTDEPSFHEKG